MSMCQVATNICFFFNIAVIFANYLCQTGNKIQGDGESDFNEEVSGGYAYRDSGKTTSPTRNRFICWLVDFR